MRHHTRPQLRGFTLIELAIVIVIAGILAAVAVPIYQSLVEDSKWAEGQAAASTVRSALDVYITENNGLPAALNGALTDAGPTAATIAQEIGLNPADLNKGKYFRADDIAIAAAAASPSSAVTYTITVTGGATAQPGAPSGSYAIDETGSVTQTP